MEAIFKTRLKSNHTLLCDTLNLEASGILDDLDEAGVISSNESEQILSNKVRKSQNSNFLYFLKRKDSSRKPFQTFLKSLKEKYDFLYNKLNMDNQFVNGAEPNLCIYCKLLNVLNPLEISHELFQLDAFSDDLLQELINNEISQENRAKLLLEIIRNCGDKQEIVTYVWKYIREKYKDITSTARDLSDLTQCKCETIMEINCEPKRVVACDGTRACTERQRCCSCINKCLKRQHTRGGTIVCTNRQLVCGDTIAWSDHAERQLTDVSAKRRFALSGTKKCSEGLLSYRGTKTCIKGRLARIGTKTCNKGPFASNGIKMCNKRRLVCSGAKVCSKRRLACRCKTMCSASRPACSSNNACTNSRLTCDGDNLCTERCSTQESRNEIALVKPVKKSSPNNMKLLKQSNTIWERLWVLRESGDWKTYDQLFQQALLVFSDNIDILVLLYRHGMARSAFYNEDYNTACTYFDLAMKDIDKANMANWHKCRLYGLKSEICARRNKFGDAQKYLSKGHLSAQCLAPCFATGTLHFYEGIYLSHLLRCQRNGSSATSIFERAKECYRTAIEHYKQESIFSIQSLSNEVYLSLALLELQVDYKTCKSINLQRNSCIDMSMVEYYLNLFENTCWSKATRWGKMMFFVARAEQHKLLDNFERSFDYLNDAKSQAVTGKFQDYLLYIESNLDALREKLHQQPKLIEIFSFSDSDILSSDDQDATFKRNERVKNTLEGKELMTQEKGKFYEPITGKRTTLDQAEKETNKKLRIV